MSGVGVVVRKDSSFKRGGGVSKIREEGGLTRFNLL